MTRDELLKSVASFAKAYINDVAEQTSERKQLIRDASVKILGEQVSNCDTCLIEKLLKIYKMADIKSKYVLRHGALLEVFSRADLAMTVHNTTDDLAELHLSLNPANLKYFEEYPADKEGNLLEINKQKAVSLKIKFGLIPGKAKNEKAEVEKLAAEKAEAEKLAAEKAEAEKLAAEKAEADPLAGM